MMRKRISVLVFAALLAAPALPAAAQSTPRGATAPAVVPVVPVVPAPRAAAAAAATADVLGAGDLIRVTVFRNPDLTTEARVSEQGTIIFPLVGEVR